MKRTSLTRKTPLRSITRIKPRSAKRRSEADAYAELRARLVLHPSASCGVCGGPYPDDVHHRREMSMGGAWTNPDNCIGVHRTCHESIHDHPGRGGWPNTRGFLVFEGDDEWESLGARAWMAR